jgi:hypothetical protein
MTYGDNFDTEAIGGYTTKPAHRKRWEHAGEIVNCATCGDTGVMLMETGGGPPTGKYEPRTLHQTHFSSKGQPTGKGRVITDYERRYLVVCLCSWDPKDEKTIEQNSWGIARAKAEAGEIEF